MGGGGATNVKIFDIFKLLQRQFRKSEFKRLGYGSYPQISIYRINGKGEGKYHIHVLLRKQSVCHWDKNKIMFFLHPFSLIWQILTKLAAHIVVGFSKEFVGTI